MNQSFRILHLEDNAADAELSRAILERAGIVCRITRVENREEFGAALRQGGHDVILADYRLPACDGMSALRLARQLARDVPFIFVSGTMGEDAAIEALTEGATDYVLKDKLSRLESAVKRALRDVENRQERKRAEEALRQSEELLRVILTNISDPLFITDNDGRFTFICPNVHGILGYSVEEIQAMGSISKLVGDRLFSPEELEMEGEIANIERLIVDKGGRQRVFLMTVKGVAIGEGTHLYALHDITKRKRAERDLRKMSLYARSLIEASLDPLVTISAEGKIMDVNEATEIVTGISREQLIGSDFSDYFTEPVRARAGYQQVFGEGSVRDYPLTLRHRLGSVTDVLYNATLYKNETGEIEGVFAAARDVTERKRSEAQVRQLQKAESLGRMAGAIAHLFNNQLQVVIGNLELAMIDLASGSDVRARLAEARMASQQVAEVSGLMLTYLGQTPGKHEPLDLSETCRRSLPMLQALIPKNVFLDYDLPATGPTVRANANQVQQILTNLITNAWEAIGDEQGAIHLSLKTVSSGEIPAVHRYPIGWRPQDNAYACLKVIDTDDGISDRNIEKIFDPFFSTKFAGRGLGLSVVLGLAVAHDGVVTVESEPGRGSVFRVFIPISSEEVSRQPDKAAEAPEVEGGSTVLLVEDNEMLRNMAEALLTRLGFSVLAAKDGVEALGVFRQRQDEIRCVLCDLTMPRMNGWETMEALRALRPDMPVILASGHDLAKVMEGKHAESPQAFLHKPYSFAELKAALAVAMGASSAASMSGD